MRAKRRGREQLTAYLALAIVQLRMSLIALALAQDLGESDIGSKHLAKLEIADF